MIEIRPALWPNDLETVRTLFHEYAAALGVDLGFQGFEAEVSELPGKYRSPAGRLLVAWRQSDALGCVGLRALDDHNCEMKRLYVRPQARGERLGSALVQRICAEARIAGYLRICLDTLPAMATAQQIYESLGFTPIAPYVFNPVSGAKFLALNL